MLMVETPRPRVVREHPKAGWLAVGTVCFGAFMGQLDASIVTLTFPALQREFGTPLAAVQWVSLAYLLTLVGLVAVAGRVADALGRKLVYGYGFAVFTLASAACGLAPGLGWLVGFRVLQALGAAMLQANSVALVVTSVRHDQARAALGVQAAAQALGLALGPALGSLLVDTAGWRWVFWVNVPIGCLALLAGRFLLPRTRERTPLGRFDWPGLGLLAVTTTSVLLLLSGFSGLRLPGWTVVALAAGFAAGAVLLYRTERRTANPLVDLSVLRPRAVSAGLAGALCGYLVLFGPLTLFPQVLGAHAGLVLTALPAGFALAALTAGKVLPSGWSTGARATLGAGISVLGTGALIFTGTTPLAAGMLLALTGIGLGVFIPANNAAIMAAIPRRMSATGGGLVNMARGLGTALGIALVTFFLHLGSVPGALGALAVAAVLMGLTGLLLRPAGARR
ncbi:MFS transporter [Amycolatopsis samaneae]|uniref:MFS transporter n=1 Tax=Amycolatopsis samaneae TaxID=664691 RepID=A0ABW5GLG9_9PSEU